MSVLLSDIVKSLHYFYYTTKVLKRTKLPNGNYYVYVPIEMQSLTEQIINFMFLKLHKNNKKITFHNLFTKDVNAKMNGKYVFTDLISSGRTDRHEIFKLDKYYLLKVTSQNSSVIRHYICIPIR